MARRTKKNISYKKYVKAYQSRQRTLRKKGYEMEYEMLDKRQFREQYKRFYNTRMQEIKEGKRKTFGNIYGEIASTQVSDVSYKQAKNIQEAGRRQGYNFDIIKIRRANMKTDPDMGEFWDFIDEYYWSGIDSGLDSVEMNKLLGQNFFGSK